jgi:GH25 family lysozyme M1 (1,4-beta-N-acetylmuramidase)
MRTDRISTIAVAAFLSCAPAWAEEVSQDEVDPRALRKFWVEQQTQVLSMAAAAPYALTAAERAKVRAPGLPPGTFGVDLSHYTFDISTSGSCATAAGYTAPNCSCTADWDTFSNNGILYVYSKASDGGGVDLSFPRFWSEMAPKHAAKTLFRGAFHFLRPGVDAKTQADTFLNAIGATNGNKPQQLPPVVDMEWATKRVSSANACPADRQTRDDNGNIYCDMWFTKTAAEIVAIATDFISRVSTATGRPVIIYTNANAWWKPVLGSTGDTLAQTQAIWTSRYPGGGPNYVSAWGNDQHEKDWNMAPLPHGASYPTPPAPYKPAHFWQFSENGVMSQDGISPIKPFTCQGAKVSRTMDMNWVPVTTQDYQTLFGVGQ